VALLAVYLTVVARRGGPAADQLSSANQMGANTP
jgi:hypothetical protein